jgi:hypothetical protein
MTQADLERARKQKVQWVKALQSEGSGRPRARHIAALRVVHQVRTVSNEFNAAVTRAHKDGYMPAGKSLEAVLKHKYTPTALCLMEFLKSNKIPLDRWILAQTETIRMRVFTLYHCYGLSAFERYQSWEKKQQTRYVREADRAKQTITRDDAIFQAIVQGHQQDIKWSPTLTRVGPPSLSAALLFMFPQVHGWYLVAHECFREDVMLSGFCEEPHLIRKWNLYKRSHRVQKVCEAALREAHICYGQLNWKPNVYAGVFERDGVSPIFGTVLERE